jgi:hypothetical protein
MRWNIIVECVGEDDKRSTITLGTIERVAGMAFQPERSC